MRKSQFLWAFVAYMCKSRDRRVNERDDPLCFMVENQLCNRHRVVNSLIKVQVALVLIFFSSPLFIF